MITTTPSHRPDRDETRPGRAARLPAFRTPVRGHAFAPQHPDLPDPEPGEPAELVPEPGNPADPHAIAVWAGTGAARRRIGYLDRGVAARVAPRLRAGVVLTARVEGWTREPEGRWQRPVVLLEVVELPEDRPERPKTPPPTASASATQAPQPPGVWGRPPGVARRTLGPAGTGPRTASRSRAR